MKKYNSPISNLTQELLKSIENQFLKSERIFYLPKELESQQEKKRLKTHEILDINEKLKINPNDQVLTEKLEILRKENEIIRKTLDGLNQEYKKYFPYVSEKDGKRFTTKTDLNKYLKVTYGIEKDNSSELNISKSKKKYSVSNDRFKSTGEGAESIKFELNGYKNLVKKCSDENGVSVYLDPAKISEISELNENIPVKASWGGLDQIDYENKKKFSINDFKDRKKYPVYCIDETSLDKYFDCNNDPNNLPRKFKADPKIQKSCSIKKKYIKEEQSGGKKIFQLKKKTKKK